jgi:tRNA 2-thiouridine synthesizing protein B
MCLAQDSILLMDDGCYNLSHTLLLQAVTNKQKLTVYFISLHADARAQSTNNSAFNAINLTEVVTLLFKHDNCVTWS